MSRDAGSLSSTEMDPRPAVRSTPAATDRNRHSAAPSPPVLGTGSGRTPRSAARKKLPDRIQGITTTSLSRLARKGGIKRIESSTYHEVKVATVDYLEDIISRAIAFAEHCDRKKVTPQDVAHALNSKGKPLHGFDK